MRPLATRRGSSSGGGVRTGTRCGGGRGGAVAPLEEARFDASGDGGRAEPFQGLPEAVQGGRGGVCGNDARGPELCGAEDCADPASAPQLQDGAALD